ncbi:MAG: formate-dependent phosphoribosylglycinamide formyltransferase [Nevskia sp.]|nr:formate-dependent phosphoribosylglycinamide formyltransferase [Nevskia sp.]
MTRFGTPLTEGALRVLLLGAGELGKELVIELQRFGVETIAVDRYPFAPAMQVAHRSHVIDMLDGSAIRRVIEGEKPRFVVPEIEAIHTPTLQALEREGFTVIPTARAARLTMDREGIRRLAAEELKLPTSPYRFAADYDEYRAAVRALGLPCVVKPVMSSSGKGQSVLKTEADLENAWDYAQKGGRAASVGRARDDRNIEACAGDGAEIDLRKVIVEGFIEFDYEITLLTVRHLDADGRATTRFCAPIGHLQIDGDYRESWQPQPMSPAALAEAQRQARVLVEELCRPEGRGVFGVEFFVKNDHVIFSEVSPRPHDTGLVTLISQDLSEFALHARAVLGLPIPNIRSRGPSASCAMVFEGQVRAPAFAGLERALAEPDTALRLFGKPEIAGHRRMGVALALGDSIEQARDKARRAAAAVRLESA